MPYAEEELKIYLLELDVTVGRININSKCSASKFTCKKAGCGKEFRVIRLFDMPEDNDDEDSIYIEEEVNSLHDHTAAEIHLRGLSVAQKVIVLQCYQRKQSGAKAIIAEFEETARRQRAINGAVVATPKEESITSFIAYHKKNERDGIPVGQTTLEDLQNFANSKAYGKI
jgi:hypothetical protein